MKTNEEKIYLARAVCVRHPSVKEDHNAGIESIRANHSNITQIIKKLVELYEKIYEIDAYHINCGSCENFANDVVELVPDAEADWGDAWTNEKDDAFLYAYHCIVRYNEKFYDSQHPHGVRNFRRISALLIESSV